MSELHIIIDDREKAIIQFIRESDIPWKVERMTTGDIAICYGGHILVIIERKTWKDLASSIKDGRVGNIKKLLKLREETGCKIMYLIEGPPCPPSNRRYGRIPVSKLRAHLDHLLFRDGVQVIHTKTGRRSIERIEELARNYVSITPSLLPEDEKKGGLTLLKKKHEANAIMIKENMLCKVQGITRNSVHCFTMSLKDLLTGQIDEKQIAVMKYPSGRSLGTKQAKRILTSIKDNKTIAHVISEIPGITFKTANLIISHLLETHPDTPLIDLLYSEDQGLWESIENLKKTAKAKVGKAAVGKLKQYLLA